MALTDETSGIPATMLVGPTGYAGGMPYPVYQGGGQGNSGNGWDSGYWIILLFILLASNGWGNNGNNGGMFGGAPIVLNDGNGGSVQRGFDQAAVMSGISGVQSGVQNLATQLCGCCGDMQMSIANSTAGIQNSLCSGFAGVNASINGAQNAISNQLYNNEIASLNRSFAEQTANTAGFNGVQSELCDIRYGNATNTRDILTALTAGVQSIKDQLCQDKIDAKNDEIAQLRQEVLYARGQASQDVQTARLLAGQTAEVDALYNRLNSCPVPTTPVYGRTPIFTCNNGCGCGNSSF